MPVILQPGYEKTVRSRLGVRESELPDADINDPLIVDLAEAIIVKRVPDYAAIADAHDLLMLQNATISYVCHFLAPSMARRLNQEVSTLDVKWKKDKIDWDERANQFLADAESFLSQISTVEVKSSGDGQILAIIKSNRNWLGGGVQ